MLTALNAWAIPPGETFETAFAGLKAAGFDGVELNVDADTDSGHSLTPAITEKELLRIRALAEDHGLRIHSVSTSLAGGLMGSDDPAERRAWRDLVRKQLECAEALGADTVLNVPGGHGPDRLLRATYAACLESLALIRTDLDQTSVRLGLENVWNGFFGSAFDMCRLIGAADHPGIGAYFDVGNVMAFSDPEHWIDTLGARIVKVHVKDFRRAGPGYHRGGTFVNLLEGDVRWPRVMDALRAVGYDGYLTAELDPMPAPPEYLYGLTRTALGHILRSGA